jgi:hypothetical protein
MRELRRWSLLLKHVSRSRNMVFVTGLLAGIVLSGVVGDPTFAAEVDSLRLVPGSCNAVAVVQMLDLVNSPLGRRGKWLDEARRAYAEGLLSSPPWVKEIVQATTIGSATRDEPLTYSIYTMTQSSIIYDISKHELAPLEKLAGHGAVVSPRNVYFVQLANGLVGAVRPANRQVVSHWVRAFDDKHPVSIAPEIVEGLKTNDGAQVVAVVDLKDMLNPRHMTNWIAGTPKLRASDDIEGLAKLLASLRTARLSMKVTDTILARLRLEFESPIGKHAPGVEKAVEQWLRDAGARPQVLVAAKAVVSGNALTFEVPLDEVGLRRVLSLLQSPHIAPQEAKAPEGGTPNALASKAYYDKVCDLLNSLLYQNREATHYENTALWHEQFARRIAHLPTTAVDPELAHWGRDVSKELTALAASLRGEAVHLDDLERSIRSDDTTYYAFYGYSENGPLWFPAWVGSTDNLEQVRGTQDAVVEKSAGQRDAVWDMLYKETTEIAKKMEDKYHIKLKLPN